MSKYSPIPKLSILIHCVYNRVTNNMLPLFTKLEEQISKLDNPKDVEIMVLLDNKRRSIGYKRDALLKIARGDYVAYVDDDDIVSDFYIEEAIKAIDENKGVDVITFKQRIFENSNGPFSITFELGYPRNDTPGLVSANAKRPPWHPCFWRRELVQNINFPDEMYGEDWLWAEQANKVATTAYHIDEYMHTYVYNDNVTEAHR